MHVQIRIYASQTSAMSFSYTQGIVHIARMKSKAAFVIAINILLTH